MKNTLLPAEREKLRAHVFRDPAGEVLRWSSWERRVFRFMDDPRKTLCVVSLPRGWGKSSLLAVLGIVELLDLEVEVHVGAGDLKQSRRVRRYMEKFVNRYPGLRAPIDVQADRALCARTGSACVYHEANPTVLGIGGAGRRLVILLDEAAIMKADVWAYFATSAAKSKDSKIVLCSTAGGASENWFDVLVEDAAKDKTGQAVVIHATGANVKPPPWLSARKMKFLGSLLPAAVRNRFFYNVAGGDGELLFTSDQVDGIFGDGIFYKKRCERKGLHAVGIDVGVRRDNCVVAVAGLHEGKAALESLRVFSPAPGRPVDLAAVETYLRHLPDRFGRCRFFFDPWQAISMAQNLRAAGCTVREIDMTEATVCRLSKIFYDVVAERRATFPPDRLFKLEIGRLIVKQRGWTWRFDHPARKKSDRCVAAALAFDGLGLGSMRKGGKIRLIGIDADGRMVADSGDPVADAVPDTFESAGCEFDIEAESPFDPLREMGHHAEFLRDRRAAIEKKRKKREVIIT